MTAWRHARAIALLPGVAAVIVPMIILVGTEQPGVGWDIEGALAVVPVLIGISLIATGFALWIWTVRLFARIGRGTLAPWDPTRRLVVDGPYRHVRNPMITAVFAVLVGEAVTFGSLALGIWAVAFLAINSAYFLLSEEPSLERRFGDEYRAYREHVPRWLPRRTPWTGPRERSGR
jgi:protein-S-isoprenylcysteine O-methyltransferase Ste14